MIILTDKGVSFVSCWYNSDEGPQFCAYSNYKRTRRRRFFKCKSGPCLLAVTWMLKNALHSSSHSRLVWASVSHHFYQLSFTSNMCCIFLTDPFVKHFEHDIEDDVASKLAIKKQWKSEKVNVSFREEIICLYKSVIGLHLLLGYCGVIWLDSIV